MEFSSRFLLLFNILHLLPVLLPPQIPNPRKTQHNTRSIKRSSLITSHRSRLIITSESHFSIINFRVLGSDKDTDGDLLRERGGGGGGGGEG